MKSFANSATKTGKIVIGPALMIAAFCLICIHPKLLADFKDADWQSLIIRIGIIIILSAGVAFRLRSLFINRHAPPHSPYRYGKFFVTLLFCSVLFFPLISQTSYIQRGAANILKSIIQAESSGLFGTIGAVLERFPGQYQQYISKSSRLHNLFIHLNSYVKIYGLSVSPNDVIALGKDGFYFEGTAVRKVEKNIREHFDHIADYLGHIPFAQEELRQWKRILEERKYWLREKGIDYVFVLAPSKALVYQEYLPAPLQMTDNSTSRYMQLSAYLRKYADVHFIDTLPPLLKAKQERQYPLLYYKTDWHWNYYGAFIAYQTIIGELMDKLPHHELIYPALNDFELSVRKNWAHRKFMEILGLPVQLHRDEHYVVMKPKRGGAYDGARHIPRDGIQDVYPKKYTLEADDGDTMQIRIVANPRAPLNSILILGDSFLEMCVLYFSGNAKRVLNYRNIIRFPDYLFKFEQPDIVVQGLLHLYLLRQPPKNPGEFADSYMRGKFADSGDNIITRKEADEFKVNVQPEHEFYELNFTGPHLVTAPEVQIAKIEIEAQDNGRMQLAFFDLDDKIVQSTLHDVKRGHNNIYVELPAGSISRFRCTGYAASTRITPRTFELRTDLPLQNLARNYTLP